MKRSREEEVEAVENTIRELQITSREVSEAFIERGLSTLTMGELLQLYDHSLPSKWWKENRVWERILRYEAGNEKVTRLERLLSRNPEPKINYKWVLLAWRLYKRHQRLVEKDPSGKEELPSIFRFINNEQLIATMSFDTSYPNTFFIASHGHTSPPSGNKYSFAIPFVLGKMGFRFESDDIQWNPPAPGIFADCALDLTLENLVMFIYFVFQIKDVYIKPVYYRRGSDDELVNNLPIRCSICQVEEVNFRHATTNALYCSKECFIAQIK